MTILKAIIFIVVLFFCWKFSACTKAGLATLNLTSQLRKDYKKTADLSFATESSLKLDVYSPEKFQTLKPVVVFFYGGSWQSGSKNQYSFLAKALSTLDLVVVIPNYRTYPEVKFPQFVFDGAMAVEWTEKEIKNYGGNPKQIYLMGHSAGAHIAALLALDEKYLQDKAKVAGWIGLAGPYDFLPFTNPIHEKIFAPKENYTLSQPINFVTQKSPRALLMHGKKDKTVGVHNSINLAKAYREKNLKIETRFYEDLSHADLVSKFSRLLRKKEFLEEIQKFIFSKTH